MLPKAGSIEEKLFELYRLLGPKWIKLALSFQFFIGGFLMFMMMLLALVSGIEG